MSDPDSMKRAAAARAAGLVRDGMRLGLGTGSTARHFVDLVGGLVRDGMRLACVPTSEQTRRQAEALGVPVTTLDDVVELDLTVDGADEVDGALNLIKGAGGALLREKIVAAASRRMIVIADAGKRVETLGAFPLPIEVVRFGVAATRRRIEGAAAGVGCSGELVLRRASDGDAYVTDEGHFILDARFRRIPDPAALAAALSGAPGVVEHGLFIGLCAGAIVASTTGVDILGSLE
ncbi:MAG: ribose 5-phosphate isomerase A [Rhizobiales bacterium 65-9]|nr:ribose-5-phosphate isomerase RpiA [Hyphomicrobiales bacterium]OJY33240.1 MAG: ribose 5-phosphate isomerase A [Rhizobiales bacterium 65-9]